MASRMKSREDLMRGNRELKSAVKDLELENEELGDRLDQIQSLADTESEEGEEGEEGEDGEDEDEEPGDGQEPDDGEDEDDGADGRVIAEFEEPA